MQNSELFKRVQMWIDVSTGEVLTQSERLYSELPGEMVNVIRTHDSHGSMASGDGETVIDNATSDEPDADMHGAEARCFGQKKGKLKYEFGSFYCVNISRGSLFMGDKDPAAVARSFFIGVHDGDDFDPRSLGLKSSARIAVQSLVETGLFHGYVSPETFDRSVMWKWKKGGSTTKLYGKLFEESLKSAVELTVPRQHANIGRLIQLLPYANKYTNILCRADRTECLNHKGYLNRRSIAGLFGVEASNSSRFVNNLLGVKFKLKGKEYSILYSTTYDGKQVFCINPRFWYAANMLRGDHILVPR